MTGTERGAHQRRLPLISITQLAVEKKQRRAGALRGGRNSFQTPDFMVTSLINKKECIGIKRKDTFITRSYGSSIAGYVVFRNDASSHASDQNLGGSPGTRMVLRYTDWPNTFGPLSRPTTEEGCRYNPKRAAHLSESRDQSTRLDSRSNFHTSARVSTRAAVKARAMNRPLMAPTEVPTMRSGIIPALTTARSCPTCNAPRLALPEMTSASGRGRV